MFSEAEEWGDTAVVGPLNDLPGFLFRWCIALPSHRLYAKEPRKYFMRLKPVRAHFETGDWSVDVGALQVSRLANDHVRASVLLAC